MNLLQEEILAGKIWLIKYKAGKKDCLPAEVLAQADVSGGPIRGKRDAGGKLEKYLVEDRFWETSICKR
ncbi:MAG: hypothetical protein WAX79_07870 [Candidatus Omnitrophota bacterium]